MYLRTCGSFKSEEMLSLRITNPQIKNLITKKGWVRKSQIRKVEEGSRYCSSKEERIGPQNS
jgi:hypothetical protein